MKKIFCLALVLSVFTVPTVPAQPNPQPMPPRPPATFQQRVNQLMAQADPSQNSQELTKFTLDFPGGTARQLADAIEKSMNKPLNVIIPNEYAETKLPPIKVTDVTAPQLFQTLLEGSYKHSSGPGPDYITSSYGFKSIGGPVNDSTIWTFYVYSQNTPGLSPFNIDFPGGTPHELIAAIQKATGKPLNAIVPEEFADTKLPPLKMNSVNVYQLFRALRLASSRTEAYAVDRGAIPGAGRFQSYQQKITGYGFDTEASPVNDDSVWYFHVDKVPTPPPPPAPEKICRFYALAPYLDHGLKVDDITTAVETAWKMTGEKSPPEISFHKDTKLLIAVGDPEKLQTIDSVLQALRSETTKPTRLPPPPEKKPDEAKPAE